MKTQDNIIRYQLRASAFAWEIAPGKIIEAWGFNNTLPGPTLRARVGDTLHVEVINDLNEPTTVHWHGLRIPSGMDGTSAVQRPILPGEHFTYRFALPDAGTFWYHSHINETVQMERGMYGAIVVEDPGDPVMDAEKVFMIDDMKLSAKNGFEQSQWFLPRFMERHDGRQGDTLLINGKEKQEIHMNAGQMERWRFVNASSARYFNLYMEGKSFRVIGTDGGLLETPLSVKELLIVPGERYDIVAGPFLPGETFRIESLPYNRMTFLKSGVQTFGTVHVGKYLPSVARLPEQLRFIETPGVPGKRVNRKITFSVGPSIKSGVNFLINGKTHVDDQPVLSGELQIWEVRNTSLMDHPFHLHGEFFQVIEVNGVSPAYKAWKDTINLKPLSKVKLIWMPGIHKGKWMYHCHILEHHEAGMMANFEVIGTEDPSPEMSRIGIVPQRKVQTHFH